MQIIKKHKVSQSEAVKRIDNFLNQLMKRELPSGVKIIEPVKNWNNNIMNFSFKAKKGIFPSQKISGLIKVIDHTISFQSELPGLVTTFVPEQKIKEIIILEFDKLFPESN